MQFLITLFKNSEKISKCLAYNKKEVENENKKRSRTAIFSTNVVHRRLIDHTIYHFYKKNNFEKKHFDGDFVGRIQADYLIQTLDEHEFENRQKK